MPSAREPCAWTLCDSESVTSATLWSCTCCCQSPLGCSALLLVTPPPVFALVNMDRSRLVLQVAVLAQISAVRQLFSDACSAYAMHFVGKTSVHEGSSASGKAMWKHICEAQCHGLVSVPCSGELILHSGEIKPGALKKVPCRISPHAACFNAHG